MNDKQEPELEDGPLKEAPGKPRYVGLCGPVQVALDRYHHSAYMLGRYGDGTPNDKYWRQAVRDREALLAVLYERLLVSIGGDEAEAMQITEEILGIKRIEEDDE